MTWLKRFVKFRKWVFDLLTRWIPPVMMELKLKEESMIIEEYTLFEEDFIDDGCWRWEGDSVIPLQDGIQHFGELPTLISDDIANSIPERTCWDLEVYRTSSCWAFDMTNTRSREKPL